jgi:hypothetical protein
MHLGAVAHHVFLHQVAVVLDEVGVAEAEDERRLWIVLLALNISLFSIGMYNYVSSEMP